MMTRLKDAAEFYEPLRKQLKGRFFRGTSSEKPKRPSYQCYALGMGTYLTWDYDMAEAYARSATEPQPTESKPVVETYELPKGLKLLDAETETMYSLRKSMGLGPHEYTGDPVQARIMAYELGKLGYDGAISEETATGLVVFDKKRLKLLKREAVQ